MEKILNYINSNKQNYIDQLVELLKYPSVSANPDHKNDVISCAKWVKDKFSEIGLKAEIYQTAGHPIVYAEYSKPANKQTLLIYGHYDVQPVDPLDLWNKPPFEPLIDGDTIYARGATDDKGQFLIHLLAAEAFLKNGEDIPVNLKFIIEGEEEIASDNLDMFIKEHKELLQADGVIVSDTAMFGKDMPAITYGLRGIAVAEIKVTGPDRDLHSGSFGGSVANPITELSRIIATFHGENYHINVSGFYDDVKELEAWEREMWATLPYEESEYLDSVGVSTGVGEAGFTSIERKWARPTCEINGIYGGYQGEGSKTIIPSWAGVKVSMRLVADQDPQDILDKFEAHVKKVASPGVKVEVFKMGGAKPAIVSRDSFLIKVGEDALQKGFGSKPYFIREGGSIPIVNVFKEELGLDTLLLGFGQHDDNAHSPNEKFSLSDFQNGIITVVHLFADLK